MKLTKLDISWATKKNGNKLSKVQIKELTKLKYIHSSRWKIYSTLSSSPLPWPCDGCNKPPNKHPNKSCSQYWIWSGDS